jgi:hypothetical protein
MEYLTKNCYFNHLTNYSKKTVTLGLLNDYTSMIIVNSMVAVKKS